MSILYDAHEATIEVGNGRVPYLSFGKGPRPLVMIPGLRLSDLTGGSRAVAWYYRLFAKDFTIYLFDRNEVLPEPCTIHSLSEDVAAPMEALGLPAAYVFGASQGGMIAQDLAIHHPELVRKLALGVTLARPNATTRAVIGHWMELAKTEGLEAIALDYMELGYSESYLKKYRRMLPLLLKAQKMMPVERFLTLAGAILTCDTYEELDKITCPVLVLGGAEDRIVTGAASVELAEKLDCEYYLYEGLSHEAYNEAKDFNQRIYDFFMA